MSEGLIVHDNPQMSVSSGAEVLSAFLENDSEKIRKQLYALLEEVRHRPYVYFKNRVPPQDYNDVVNDLAVDIASIKSAQLLKINDLKRYFGTMLRNALSNYFRETGNRVTEDLELYGNALSSKMPNPERLAINAQISSIIDSLPSLNKEVLQLDLQGFSDEEIANKLGIKLKTIKTRLYRAKKTLEKKLNGKQKIGPK